MKSLILRIAFMLIMGYGLYLMTNSDKLVVSTLIMILAVLIPAYDSLTEDKKNDHTTQSKK